MKRLALIVAFVLATAASAEAASYGIYPNGYQTYDNAKYERLADCHLTDSMVTSSFAGSLAPGQSFSTYLDLCYSDQYIVLYGVDEQTDENFAFNLSARGNLAVGLTLQRRDYPDRVLPVAFTPGNPLNSWVGCAYSTYWVTYDANNMSQYGGARLLVTLANNTSHVVRNIGLTLYLGWPTDAWSTQHPGC